MMQRYSILQCIRACNNDIELLCCKIISPTVENFLLWCGYGGGSATNCFSQIVVSIKKLLMHFLHFSKLFAILISTIAQYIIAKWVIFSNVFILLSKKTWTRSARHSVWKKTQKNTLQISKTFLVLHPKPLVRAIGMVTCNHVHCISNLHI